MENLQGMRRLLCVPILVILVLGGAAQAHDHRAPKASLMIGSQVQRGFLYHADGWTKRTNDGFCSASFGSGFPTFRKPLSYVPGDQVVARFHKSAAPLEVEVQRWPRIDENGRASGTPTPLPWVLRPYRDGAAEGWEIVIPPPLGKKHMYLGVGAYWADEDGCVQGPDLGSQFASWTFHLVNR